MSKRPEGCGTCKFWDHEHGDRYGQCHRSPPSLPSYPAQTSNIHDGGVFPATERDDWCGEWVILGGVRPLISAAEAATKINELSTLITREDALKRMHELEDERKILYKLIRAIREKELRGK